MRRSTPSEALTARRRREEKIALDELSLHALVLPRPPQLGVANRRIFPARNAKERLRPESTAPRPLQQTSPSLWTSGHHRLDQEPSESAALHAACERRPSSPNHDSVSRKLGDLHEAMLRFQSVADTAVLNMTMRIDKESVENSRQWLQTTTLAEEDHGETVRDILTDVISSSAAMLNQLGDVRKEATPHASAKGVADENLQEKVNLNDFLDRKPSTTAEIERKASLSSPLTAESFATSETIDLHTSLLHILQHARLSHERIIVRGNISLAQKQLSSIRSIASDALLQLHTLNTTVTESRRALAAAELRCDDVCAAKDSQKCRPPSEAECEQTVVVAELPGLAQAALTVPREAIIKTEHIYQAIVARTAQSAGGTLLFASHEAVAVGFASAWDALGWAQAMNLFSVAFPWPDEALVSGWLPVHRDILSQHDVEATREAMVARASSIPALQRINQIQSAFIAAINAEGETSSGNPLEAAVKYIRRGPRIRIGLHHCSPSRDGARYTAVHPGVYGAAALVSLLRPGETAMSDTVLRAVQQRHMVQGDALSLMDAKANDVSSFDPLTETLRAVGVLSASRIVFDGVGDRAERIATPGFDALAWMTRSFANVHSDAVYSQGLAGGGTRFVHQFAQTEEYTHVDSTSKTNLKRKHTMVSHGKVSREEPAVDAVEGTIRPLAMDAVSIETLPSPKLNRPTPKRKAGSRGKLSGTMLSDEASAASFRRSGSTLRPMMDLLSGASNQDVQHDAQCQCGSIGAHLGVFSTGESLARHSISLLAAVLGRSLNRVSVGEVCDRIAALLACDITASDLIPSQDPLAAAGAFSFTSPIYRTTWDEVWERLNNRLHELIPRVAAGQPVDEASLCRDVICCTIALLDEALEFSRARLGEDASTELGELLRRHAGPVELFTKVTRDDRVRPSGLKASVSFADSSHVLNASLY